MLALYILGMMGVYAGIGKRVSNITIDYYAEEEYCEERIAKEATVAFFFWPFWLFTDGPKMFFKKRIRKSLMLAETIREQNEAVQNLLTSGELDE